MLKKREEIRQILEMNISDNEKIEKIAKLNTITTDINRIILIDNVEDLELEEGQTVNNLGNSWADRNKNCEYMTTEGMGNIKVILAANNVSGYEVQYLNLDYLMYDLDLDEEEAEEIEFDEVYQELLELLGTDSDASQESEVLVSNDTRFKVSKIYGYDEDANSIEVELV